MNTYSLKTDEEDMIKCSDEAYSNMKFTYSLRTMKRTGCDDKIKGIQIFELHVHAKDN